MKKLITLLALISMTALGQVVGVKEVRNKNQDKDVKLCVNDGGVERCPLKVEGATGDVNVNNLLIVQEADNNVKVESGNSSTPVMIINGTGTADRLEIQNSGVETVRVEDDGKVVMGQGLIVANPGASHVGHWGYTPTPCGNNATSCAFLDIEIGANSTCVFWFSGNRGNSDDLYLGQFMARRRTGGTFLRVAEVFESKAANIVGINISESGTNIRFSQTAAAGGAGNPSFQMWMQCYGQSGLPTFTDL